jgi:hypothetical protein
MAEFSGFVLETLRTRLCVTLMLVVGSATLIFGCERADKQSGSVAEAAPDEATRQTTPKAPPIPAAGPLARPKSPSTSWRARGRDSRSDTA